MIKIKNQLLLEDRRFYVYGYFNPIDGKLFYIGRGKENRLYDHLNNVLKNKKDTNRYKFNKIKQILNLGFQPIIKKLKKNLTIFEANTLEKWYIKKFKPFLTNLTDGGEGLLNPSNEIRKILSIKSSTRKHKKDSAETRRRKSESRKGNKNPRYGKNDHCYGLYNFSKNNIGKNYNEIYGEEKAKKILLKFDHKGKKNPMYGKHHKQNSKILMQKPKSAETKLKFKNNAKDRVWINKDTIIKHPKKEFLHKFLNEGWKLGTGKFKNKVNL